MKKYRFERKGRRSFDTALEYDTCEDDSLASGRSPMTIDVDTLVGESASADFKSSFDPDSKGEWCELIKDIVATSNSGGGLIIVGVDDDGNPLANADIAPLLAVDPADVTNRLYSYTDQHFAEFEIVQSIRRDKPVAVIKVGPSDIPIVFTAHGGYGIPGGQKTAFVKGSVYFRHGAKSEPGTTDDLRHALERKLGQVKEFWLAGIGKIMAAPAGSDVQISSASCHIEGFRGSGACSPNNRWRRDRNRYQQRCPSGRARRAAHPVD
jgi:hypothetical protein